MNRPVLGSGKSKWLLVTIFLTITIASSTWTTRQRGSAVELYAFSETVDNPPIELQTIRWRGTPYTVLFANAVKSPFAFDVDLGRKPAPGIRSLWIYAGQADNHGQITIQYGGKTVGTVDNRLAEKSAAPVPKLSYVGDLEIAGGNVVLRVTSSNDKFDRHYAELALMVLAPRGTSAETIAGRLNGQEPAPATDVGVLLAVLIAAYGLLVVVARRDGPDQAYNFTDDILAAVVLVAVCLFSYQAGEPDLTTPLEDTRAGERTGFEGWIDSGFKAAIADLDELQREILPDRRLEDEVPLQVQSSAGSLETDIYRVDQPEDFEKVSQAIFSGRYASLQLMPSGQFRSLVCWMLILLSIAALLDWFVRSWWSSTTALGLISVLSVLLSVRVSQGWDEFFINLRHSYMLVHHGVYSVNAHSMIEGTVDLLPLLATAGIGWIGVSLVDAFIVVSLLGNVCVVVFSYLFVRKLTQDQTWALVTALLIGLYPNVLQVGGTGFSAVLFTGWILGASYFLLFSDWRRSGLLLLSSLTLVRTEGILFAALLTAYLYVLEPFPSVVRTGQWRSAAKKALVDGTIVVAPFAISLLARRIVFGHAIPNPMSFKNTGLDSSYISTGLDRFSKMVSSHDLHLTILLTVLLVFVNILVWKNHRHAAWKTGGRRLLVLTLVIFLFTLPYYIGGGDWFPVIWNRYGLPFNLVLLVTFMVMLHGAFVPGLKPWAGAAGLIVFSLSMAGGYHNSARFRPDNYISETLSDAFGTPTGRWGRVDDLASLGQFLKKTLPEDAVVSSPEEATIMYFSGKEMLGLLGVSNPDIAVMPLQPLNPGDPLHRRRGYASVFKTRPDVIALYEPVVIGNFGESPDLLAKLHDTLQNQMFGPVMVDIAYYRVGSFKALQRMGYRHLSIAFSDRMFSLFISDRIHDAFVETLRTIGFSHLGSDFISYAVRPELSKEYVPAVQELIPDLYDATGR